MDSPAFSRFITCGITEADGEKTGELQNQATHVLSSLTILGCLNYLKPHFKTRLFRDLFQHHELELLRCLLP